MFELKQLNNQNNNWTVKYFQRCLDKDGYKEIGSVTATFSLYPPLSYEVIHSYPNSKYIFVVPQVTSLKVKVIKKEEVAEILATEQFYKKHYAFQEGSQLRTIMAALKDQEIREAQNLLTKHGITDWILKND